MVPTRAPGTGTVTASLFATQRHVRQPDGLRHRRGDSALRTLGYKPTTIAELRGWST